MTRWRTQTLNRREALGALSSAMGAALAQGCGGSPTSPTATTGTTTGNTGGATTGGGGTSTTTGCAVAPSETQGPYPDRLGMINNPAFFRRDVREGRAGLTLTLELTIVNVNGNCAPLSGANIEIWQCDGEGHYSEYAQPGYDGTGQTYLRGLQTTDSAGRVTFLTIYPGWYQGRATHIHVDVFVGGRNVKTTQIAFPEDISAEVYRTGVYAAKGQNPTTNARDNVFSDGTSLEMATLSGSTSSGYMATLTIGVAV